MVFVVPGLAASADNDFLVGEFVFPPQFELQRRQLRRGWNVARPRLPVSDRGSIS